MRKLNIERGKIHVTILIFLLVASCVLIQPLEVHAVKNKFITIAGKTYYYNSKEMKTKGLKKIKGKYYYFNKKGVLYKKGWKKIKGKRYYFAKKSGAAYVGARKVKGKKYLFSAKGKRTGTGLHKYKKNLYYTKKGVIQIGLKRVNGKLYYFQTSGKAKRGWATVNGGKYYFGSDYVAYSGIKKIKGITYQFDENGEFVKVVSTSGNSGENEAGDTDNSTGASGDGGSGSGTTIKNPATMFDSWEVEGAINRFNDKISRFNGNGLTLTTAAQAIVSQFNGKKSGYQVMISNYGNYTKTQLEGATSEIDEMTSRLKVNVELVYYPEQSRAIFNAINEYRAEKGVDSLTWSDNLSIAARYQCGYACYTYPSGTNLGSHAGNQLSVCAYNGSVGVSEALSGWKASGMHEPYLWQKSNTHGAVAYYSFNDEDGGIWSNAIFAYGIATSVGYNHCPDSYKELMLKCKTRSAVYN